MNNKDDDALQPPAGDNPPDAGRRRFLGGVAALGVGATLSAYVSGNEPPAKPDDKPLTGAALDQALRDNVKTVVVIYAENRSFNNLFGDFPGVEKPLAALTTNDYQQRDRDGSILESLPPVWGGILQIGPQTVEDRKSVV